MFLAWKKYKFTIFFFLSSSLLVSNTDLTSTEDAEYETEHDLRKRQYASSDFVHTMDLREVFQNQVRQLSVQLGETRYSEIMNNVDVETMKNMRDYITI